MSLENMPRGRLQGFKHSSPGDVPGSKHGFGSAHGKGSATQKLETSGFIAENEAAKKALEGEKELQQIKTLQAKAGLVVAQTERLDWMYEQSAAQKQDDEKMNEKVKIDGDEDFQKVRTLASNAGSLFLKSDKLTKTSEDMIRKLREDPLFQIRQQESVRRENALANPLTMKRLDALKQKMAKKESKKDKKKAKKEKKKLKKQMKKEGKKKKKGSSSDSSSSESVTGERPGAQRKRSRSVDNLKERLMSKSRLDKDGPAAAPESSLAHLGPSASLVNAREERDRNSQAQKDAALASRGLGSRLTEAEKERRLKAMQADASVHEKKKDKRIGEHEKKLADKAAQEDEWKKKGDQKVFKEMKKDAYMDGNMTLSERMDQQRHRRQKSIMDPLERDD